MHFTSRSERNARVVLERQADAAVGSSPQNVGLIDDLSGLRCHHRVAANEVDRPRNHLDSTGGRRLLGERRSRHENRDEDADDESKLMGHMRSYRRKYLLTSQEDRTARNRADWRRVTISS